MKLLLAVVASLAFVAPARAATTEAAIRDNFFDPAAITVDQGDTVNWTNDGAVGHTVTFSGFGSPGTLAPTDTFNHIFASAGTFNFHCQIHLSMTGSVKVLGPTAVAKASSKQVLTGVSVNFNGTSSSHNDPAGSIVSYEWDFDDGTTGSGELVAHSFTDPGTYDVMLTVTDAKGATDTGTVRVTAALTALRISNVRIRESDAGTRSARFVVRLTRASIATTTVHFATVHGTARSPGDYGARSGNLTFLPGQLTKLVVVKVRGDLRDERNETFFVRLSNPGNAIFADARGLGTIVDDD